MALTTRAFGRGLASRNGLPGARSGGYVTSAAAATAPSSLRLNRAIQKAEKITGHTTGRMSEKLLNLGELQTFLGSVTKMMGTQHPIVDSVKQLLFQQSANIQTRGLLVSLLIKASGVAPGHTDTPDVILERQHLVISATEEFHAAQTIHASAMDVSVADRTRLDSVVLDDLEIGNKMTVLAGDFFFSRAFQTTCNIGIPVMLHIFGTAVEDYVRSYFESDLSQVKSVDAMWWETKTCLKTCSLLASGYRAATMVGGLSQQQQDTAYQLGKHIALAFQTYHETKQFLNTSYSSGLNYDITSLPIILHMETHPELLRSAQEGKVSELQFAKVHSEIMSGDALERIHVMLGYYIQEAQLLAQGLGASEATKSLIGIVSSLRDI